MQEEKARNENRHCRRIKIGALQEKVCNEDKHSRRRRGIKIEIYRAIPRLIMGKIKKKTSRYILLKQEGTEKAKNPNHLMLLSL